MQLPTLVRQHNSRKWCLHLNQEQSAIWLFNLQPSMYLSSGKYKILIFRVNLDFSVFYRPIDESRQQSAD